MAFTKEYLIETLQLQPHPEGGYFKETYRSETEIGSDSLSENYEGSRNTSTAIYFLLTSDQFSAFHKIEQDELWHFHLGSTIELHTLSPEGIHKTHRIGNELIAGDQLQLTVPGNHWFAARALGDDAWALVSCTVAPGFDFRDFILAKQADLSALFPQHSDVIAAFTRQ